MMSISESTFVYSLLFVLLLIIAVTVSCTRSRSAKPSAKVSMIPWLSSTGTFGYSDSSGTMIIKPHFFDAQPGVGGYAFAAKDSLKYGVINSKGATILPFKYSFVKLIPTAGAPLAITKREYNAWWRFWEWKLFPELDLIFGGGLGKHWIVTYVPRAVWKVHNLATRKTLFSSNRSDDIGPWGRMYWKKSWYPNRSVPNDINVQSWVDGFVLAQHTLFKFDQNNRLKKKSQHIFGRLTDDAFLQHSGDSTYRRVNANGQRQDEETYTLKQAAQFKDKNNQTLTLPKAREAMMRDPIIPADIFESKKRHFYLFPDLSMPLPATVTDFIFDDGNVISCKDIVNATVQLAAIPNSSWVMLLSAIKKDPNDSTGGYYTFLINSKGQWAPKYQPRKGLKMIMGDGRLIFSKKSPVGVLDTNLIFHSLPVQNFHASGYSNDLYIGSDGGPSGAYDVNKKQWTFKSDSVGIGYEIAPGIARYSKPGAHPVGAPGVYGLINLETGKKITPMDYDRIQQDGRVTQTVNGEKIEFYINLQTGEEYRDTNTK